MLETTTTSTLYGGLAESITNLIEAGTFREGDKIPSIRTMSRQYGVSVNTVREAYWVLETRRFIESRPQSGYFVRRKAPKAISAPSTFERDVLNPHEIAPCSLREHIPTLMAGKPYRGFELARAAISVDLFPTKKLNAYLGAVSRESGEALMDYDSRRGLPELRNEVAKLSLDAGIRLSPDDFLITGGCLPAINLALDILCRAGDTVVVESPTYSEFLKLLKGKGLRVLEIPTSPQDGISLEVLEWALERHEVKVVLVVPTFNNPVAFTMPDHKKKALVELLARRGIPLIEDDAYGDLSFLDQRPLACKAFDTTGNVIYCTSVSKTISAGYRVGWMAGGLWNDALMDRKTMISDSASLPTQMAIARYLRDGNYVRHIRNLRHRLADHTGAMAETIAANFPPGTGLSRPVGGTFLWVQLPTGIDAEELYGRAVEEGIYFRPGIVFSGSDHFRNYLRLGTGAWSSDLEKAVARLGVMASQWNPTQPQEN